MEAALRAVIGFDSSSFEGDEVGYSGGEDFGLTKDKCAEPK
jgi:hypothetical protein